MLTMSPSKARMLAILALKHKDPEKWTRESLADYFGVSKITINHAMNSAREFDVVFKKERALVIVSWGAFSKPWVIAHLEELAQLGKSKEQGK